MESNWTKEFLTSFLEEYRNHPELWNVRCREYRDKYKKDKAYDILIEKMKEMEPEATRDSVKRKINILRTNFRKELRKYNRRKAEGIMYRPTLWYFKHMLFLCNQKPTIEAQCHIKQEDIQLLKLEIPEETEIPEEPELLNIPEGIDETSVQQSLQPESPLYTIHSERSYSEDYQEIPMVQEIKKKWEEIKFSHIPNLTEDRFDYVGKNIAAKLRELKSDQRIIAEKLLSDVMFLAELGNLTPYSSVQNPEGFHRERYSGQEGNTHVQHFPATSSFQHS